MQSKTKHANIHGSNIIQRHGNMEVTAHSYFQHAKQNKTCKHSWLTHPQYLSSCQAKFSCTHASSKTFMYIRQRHSYGLRNKTMHSHGTFILHTSSRQTHFHSKFMQGLMQRWQTPHGTTGHLRQNMQTQRANKDITVNKTKSLCHSRKQ